MEKNLFLEKWNKLTRQRITTKIKKVANKMNQARVVVQNDKKFDNSISLFHIKVVKREYNTRHEGIFFINPNRSFSPHHSFFFSYISFSILPFPIVIFPFLSYQINNILSYLYSSVVRSGKHLSQAEQDSSATSWLGKSTEKS